MVSGPILKVEDADGNLIEGGLLLEFLNRKLDAYAEPIRKGTPRGEPVGFPRAKYWATLLALTNTPLERTAAMVAISYSLLTKWRTEPAFKKKVAEHIEEFADLYLEDDQQERKMFHHLTSKTTLAELADLPPQALLEKLDRRLANPTGYHPRVLRAIADRIAARLRDDPEMFSAAMSLADLLVLRSGPGTSPIFEDLRSRLRLDGIKRLVAILAKDRPTAYERRLALIIAKCLGSDIFAQERQ